VTAVFPLLTKNVAFTPEATHVMGEAFDRACLVLGPIPPAVKETIANRVIEQAATGERDPDRLLLAGLKGISI
jgi:hypothetical protein